MRRSALSAVALVAAAAVAPAETWPPFLPTQSTFAPDVALSIERVWSEPTFVRRVQSRAIPMPSDVYVAFADSPEVTAGAARHLGLTRYAVRTLGPDWYEADDGHGARGTYRVLAREPTRRVLLSQGSHAGNVLGRISGSAVTILDFPARDGRIVPELTTYVRLDNAAVAAVARALIAIFGAIADRKLSQGFDVAAKVMQWAVSRPSEFCAWIAREPATAEERARVLAVLPRCPSHLDRHGALSPGWRLSESQRHQ